ncbi:MAG: GatB/YqeY domain-containing protein [Desulfonatronovibrio sp. MSAO_Bac4]|nr:MAG: GatB/YqeY domain-containing protein [Desulfonatronovibrio sp. MSAO_Bac4]
MMITERIEKDFILAYKNKESEKVAVLRLLKAAFKNKQVELRKELSDAEALDVLIKEVKQRQESIRQYSEAGRNDLSGREQDELKIINAYLPRSFTSQEMESVAKEVIQELEIADIKGMGLVMKAISQKYPGQTDGRQLSTIVRQLLSS